MNEVKHIRKILPLKIRKPLDVACHGNGRPHIITITKFYVINGVAYAYCKEHDLFFHIDDKKEDIRKELRA